MRCPRCAGDGSLVCHVSKSDGTGGFMPMPCEQCDGSGELSPERFNWFVSGDVFASTMLVDGVTLRRGAEMLGVTALELSKARRGLVDPGPLRQKYAEMRKSGGEA